MLAVLAATVLAATPAAWEDTLERVVEAVVAIRTTAPRSFDTSGASNGVATGFVVDAERGLILSNRHVVKPGPNVSEAVFQNHEEVALAAVYRDPVHDFGIYRFDPSEVEHMELVALPLAPEAARVGSEIRVVGNDAGEKLSILEGTLARLDRAAPNYGQGRFNDFNTFYFQAASGTSGGSSGSPVVDVDGNVVALNAGSNTRSASSFYLPLDRVVRALDLVRAGEPVPRGTLQTTFAHEPFDELARLGLPATTEARVRAAFPQATGMLTVARALPQGPADGRLKVGDILVSVGGDELTAFLPLAEALDSNVGEPLALSIVRQGEALDVEVTVQDLHAISPASYIEVGRAVLHDLSYQKARTYAAPVTGVYLAENGDLFDRAGIANGAVFEQVGDTPTPDLASFEAALAKLPDGARVPFTYRVLSNRSRRNLAVVQIDRRWWPGRHCDRNDDTGWWDCVDLDAPAEAQGPEPGRATFPPPTGKMAKKLAQSLVWVNYDIPFGLDGTPGLKFVGTGVVVDAERGLVLVDRHTVTSPLGDVRVTIGGSLEVPGRVEWLHPVHNYGLISYDPALVGDTNVKAVSFVDLDLEPGDELTAVGLTPQFEVLQSEVQVAQVTALYSPNTSPPRFRQYNADGVYLASAPGIAGGVLVDKRGRVAAHWVSQSIDNGKKNGSRWVGLQSHIALDAIGAFRAGRRPQLRRLGAEVWRTDLVDGRNRGLDDAQVDRLARAGGRRSGVLYVGRMEEGTPADGALQEGDLLLAANDRPLVTFRELEVAAQAPELTLTVVRGGQTQDVTLATVPVDGRGTDRALVWAGMLLQAPFQTLAAQSGVERTGVYISRWWHGSPAHRYGLRATRRIVSVDGTATPDLDAFLAATSSCAHRDTVRLETIDMQGKPALETLKLDLHYWPTAELRWTEDGWARTER